MVDRRGAILFAITETPLHAGAGAELGVVDLPIQRERYTGWPKVEASSFKGALREYHESGEKDILFGPESGDLHAGAISLTDMRLLLFPVRSLKGTFAWIISPDSYSRFRKDMEVLRNIDRNIGLESLPETLSPGRVCDGSINVLSTNGSDIVLLEEYSVRVEKEGDDDNLCKFVNWLKEALGDDPRKEEIKKRIVVVENDFFNDMVTMYTEVITRIRIDRETGTASDKGLWNEEYLPADTLMYSLVFASRPMVKDEDILLNSQDEVLKEFLKGLPRYIFLGGNTTVGKGLVRISSFPGEESHEDGGAAEE